MCAVMLVNVIICWNGLWPGVEGRYGDAVCRKYF